MHKVQRSLNNRRSYIQRGALAQVSLFSFLVFFGALVVGEASLFWYLGPDEGLGTDVSFVAFCGSVRCKIGRHIDFDGN